MPVAENPSPRVFRPELLLGSGAFGEVYRAVMEADGLAITVALKLLNSQATGIDEQAALRLRDEASFLAALSHRAIPRVYAITEVEGRLAVAMEFIEGADGATVFLKGRDRPPVKAAVEILAEVAGALHAAHAAKQGPIIHRDVKPANLMVAHDGSVRLMDFGIAAAAEGRTARTETGTVVGTWAYMAPERFHGDKAEPSWDVYALGVMIYEAAVGRPFWAGHPGHSIVRTATDESDQREHVHARLSELAALPELQQLARECLSFDPARRPSASAFEHRARRMLGVLPGASLWEWSHGVDWRALSATHPTPIDHSLVGEVLVPTTHAALGTPLPRSSSGRWRGLLVGTGLLAILGGLTGLGLLGALALVLMQETASREGGDAAATVAEPPKAPAAPLVTEHEAEATPATPEETTPPTLDEAAPAAILAPTAAPATVQQPAPSAPVSATPVAMPEPPTAPRTGNVTLTPPAIELRGDLGVFGSGEVAVGRYTIYAAFGSEAVHAGTLEVGQGSALVVSCSTLKRECFGAPAAP